MVAPLINGCDQAEYINANARQIQALVEYQRTVLNAFTEVVNRISKVQNYSQSIELKRQQLASLETAVDAANKLFQNARLKYLDVLTVLRDRNEGTDRFDRNQAGAALGNRQRLPSPWRRLALRGWTDPVAAAGLRRTASSAAATPRAARRGNPSSGRQPDGAPAGPGPGSRARTGSRADARPGQVR